MKTAHSGLFSRCEVYKTYVLNNLLYLRSRANMYTTKGEQPQSIRRNKKMEKQEILENIKLATEEIGFILWDGPRFSNQQAVLENIDKALRKGWNTIPPKDLQLALAQGLMAAATILTSMENGED